MKCSWSNSELELVLDCEVSEEVIRHLNKCSPMYNGEYIQDLRAHICNNDTITIFPATSNLFICDNQFIKSCADPIALFRYYKGKVGNNMMPLTLVQQTDSFVIEPIQCSEETIEVYQEMLDTVILDVGSLKKSSITTPPEIFHILSEQSNNGYPYCSFLSEFLSLMAISDKIISLDENLNKFEFQIFAKDRMVKFQYTWLDTESMKNEFWHSCYKWITSDEHKSVDIKLKRDIVREVIVKNYTDESVKISTEVKSSELIRIFNNILRLIVAGRTQEYFDTQKTLKAEYIDIYSKNFDAFSNVVNSILALFVALVAGMYGVLFAQGDVFDFFSPNKSIGLLLIIMLFAEFFVLLSSIVKFITHNRHIKELKRINLEKLMISYEEQKCLSVRRSLMVSFVYIVLTIIIALTIGGIFWFMRS